MGACASRQRYFYEKLASLVLAPSGSDGRLCCTGHSRAGAVVGYVPIEKVVILLVRSHIHHPCHLFAKPAEILLQNSVRASPKHVLDILQLSSHCSIARRANWKPYIADARPNKLAMVSLHPYNKRTSILIHIASLKG